MKLTLEAYAYAILACYITILCFKMHGQQRMTQVHRKKDDGRQHEAEGKRTVVRM